MNIEGVKKEKKSKREQEKKNIKSNLNQGARQHV